MNPPPVTPGPVPTDPAAPGPATTGRMRVAAGLSVCGFAMLMVGAITILVGHAIRPRAPESWRVISPLGEAAVACGLGCLLALLLAKLPGWVARARAARSPRAPSHEARSPGALSPEARSPEAHSPVAAAPGGALHEHGVDPAAVLAADRGEAAGHGKPGRRVQRR